MRQLSEAERQSPAYFLANSLTMGRAALGLCSAVALWGGDTGTALTFLGAGLLTECDGTIARRFNVTSREGAARDLLADMSWILPIVPLTIGFFNSILMNDQSFWAGVGMGGGTIFGFATLAIIEARYTLINGRRR